MVWTEGRIEASALVLFDIMEEAAGGVDRPFNAVESCHERGLFKGANESKMRAGSERKCCHLVGFI